MANPFDKFDEVNPFDKFDAVEAKPAKEMFDVRTLMPPKYDATNANAGAIRGAGSIGATLLRPKDLLEAWIAKQMGADMPAPDRRAGMDAALTSLGADTK